MKKLLLFNFLLILNCCATTKIFAQIDDTVQTQYDKNDKLTFAKFKDKSPEKRSWASPEQFLKLMLKAKKEDGFHLIQLRKDDLGITHIAFQQYYKEIKVQGANYLLHGKNSIEVMNGNFVELNIQDVVAKITVGSAMKTAISFVGAKKYKWEDQASEEFVKKDRSDSNASYFPKGELVICKALLKPEMDWRLAWKFTISALEPNTEQYVYIDALSGKVINYESLITDINTPGTAQTSYSSTRAIVGDSFSGGFRLRENRNGVDVQTLNMQSGTNYTGAIDFTDNDNNWNAAEHSMNRDRAALDAHWGTETVLDYWRIVHNRNSIDGNGLRIISYVHYSSNWDNAQWDSNNRVMRYGDGSIFSPLTSLDICAHEFGHGICQALIPPNGLTYQGESGALNEGFSDIWGAVIENWADPSKQTWLIGEEIGVPLRSMINPNTYSDPDTYNGQNWRNPNDINNDAGGVHHNSGVLNFWFYLLSIGGNGTNDINNNYSVTGIGIGDAARIAYRTEGYLVTGANFANARNASIQAAIDLFGR